jgi:hypothetical protein
MDEFGTCRCGHSRTLVSRVPKSQCVCLDNSINLRAACNGGTCFYFSEVCEYNILYHIAINDTPQSSRGTTHGLPPSQNHEHPGLPRPYGPDPHAHNLYPIQSLANIIHHVTRLTSCHAVLHDDVLPSSLRPPAHNPT